MFLIIRMLFFYSSDCIKGRLVENSALKQTLEDLYSPLLLKGKKPFVYLSLHVTVSFPFLFFFDHVSQMRPEDVDPNMHPTKREVRFLHESDIASALHSAVSEALRSRIFSHKRIPKTFLNFLSHVRLDLSFVLFCLA